MKREAEEDQPVDAGQGRVGLGLRRHATAEGLAAGEEGNARQPLRRLGHGRAHRRVRDLGRVGALRALRHVVEVVAIRRDVARLETLGDRGHERMRHARTRAMREDIEGARLRRCGEQAHRPACACFMSDCA